jgi:hypothetical protein
VAETRWFSPTLAVFDEDTQQYTNLSLFPDDRRRPRPFGNCWLVSERWQQLGLSFNQMSPLAPRRR